KYKDDLFKIYPLSFHYYQSRKNEQREALRLIGEKLKLLKEMGHIRNGVLTEKGLFAKTVYGYELLLSELYETRILEQLDAFGLGVLTVSIVFEPRKNQQFPLGVSKGSRKIKELCEKIYLQLQEKERKHRIYPFIKLPSFHLSVAMEFWLRGTSFDKILQYTDTDEGEVVRYFRMSVQILREIKDAPVVSHILKDTIKETIRVINRDLIDAEKQLRES
ncbi:MAG: hypothetical protein KKC84_05785, partial [Candidatus Omnitrophica bacterium]|nr:hypothetical protein [Candidatus Omnitrophota bacterium]